MAKQIHINVNVLGSGSHQASWMAPGGRPLGVVDIRHYQEIARIAERGRLDAVFLADALAIPADPSAGLAWALDPVVTVAGMAAVTERVGFIASSSTTFAEPYHVARAFASLDHASAGRVGWNVVTTYDDRAAPNFARAQLPPPAERYARAAEFVDVVLELWDSWEDAALVADKGRGIFADASRIHAIGHRGRHFDVAGPLQLPRSPQGRPLLVQAGSSPAGRDLGARYADAVFAVQQTLPEARAYYADMKARATRFGRDPGSLAILPGLSLVVGSTEAEAKSRKRDIDALVDGEITLTRFAARIGAAPDELSLDAPVPAHVLERIPTLRGSQGFADATFALARDRSLTVREIIYRGGGAHRLLVGGPGQIADSMQEWVEAGAADGFNIMCDVFPEGLEAFVDHVVPELRRRGLFRHDYDGPTLRDHYGLARPESRFAVDQVA